MKTKFLLYCGILSSLFYVAMNIVVPMYFEGYSSVSQTVSELSAVGAPTRELWVSLGILYTLLITAFGWGVWHSADRNRYQRITGILIFIYSMVSFIWPFAPMHGREVLAAGGKTFSDTLHIALATVTVFLMILAMGYGAVAFGKKFLIYSITTIMILLVFGGLTGADATHVEANLPTPWIGVWERINIGVFLLWVIVLSVFLLRSSKSQTQLSNG